MKTFFNGHFLTLVSSSLHGNRKMLTQNLETMTLLHALLVTVTYTNSIEWASFYYYTDPPFLGGVFYVCSYVALLQNLVGLMSSVLLLTICGRLDQTDECYYFALVARRELRQPWNKCLQALVITIVALLDYTVIVVGPYISEADAMEGRERRVAGGGPTRSCASGAAGGDTGAGTLNAAALPAGGEQKKKKKTKRGRHSMPSRQRRRAAKQREAWAVGVLGPGPS